MLIQQLRDGSDGILAKVIIGLIIIVFAMFGLGSITTFLAPTPTVVEVNGEGVSEQDMEFAVERNRRLLLARGATPEDIDEDELRESVLQSLITREVLNQAAEEMELFYGDAALDSNIVSSEVFQIDGVFDVDQFQRVIASAGYSPLEYRQEMRTDQLFTQIITGIRQTAFVTDLEAQRYSGLVSQARDLAYLQIKASDLIEEVTVSDEQIDDYYRSNTQDFVTDETVSLQFVALDRQAYANDLDIDEAALAQYFSENQSDYSSEESRRMAHILVEFAEGVTEDESRTRADALYEQIKQGEDFTILARDNSDDFGSKELGGDLGFNPQGTFFPEFEAAVYDLALNQVSEPVKTEAGFHIIKVLEIEDAVQPPLAEVRDDVELAFRLSATEDDFVTSSSRLAELLFESIDLEVPASEIGLEIQTTGQLNRDSDHQLMTNSKTVSAVFSADVLLDGNNSDLIDISDDYHVGLRVVEHNPSANKPIAEVTEDIRYILQRQAASELAQSRATLILELIQGGSLAQYVADEYGLTWELFPGAVRQQPDIQPFVLAEAFKLPRPAEDKESLSTMTLPNGDGAVLRISRVVDKPVDELAELGYSALQRTLSTQLGAVDFQEYESSLKAEASID